MSKKAYILTFDREQDKSYLDFHNKLAALSEIENWFHYIKSSYILITKFEDTSDLNKLIKEIIPNKRFFIVEINLDNTGGYLPEQAWDWIKKYRAKTK